MPKLPTLRRELLAALAAVFAGALVVAGVGIVLLLHFLGGSPAIALAGLLLLADAAVVSAITRRLVQRRVMLPIQRMIEGAEAIAAGEYALRLPHQGTAELSRLAEAVNRIAEHMIAHQEALAANVRSLEDTNQELTTARDAMIRTEKMASVGRLAAGIAHEIGNPLGAILGYLGLVGRKAAPPQQELVRNAEAEARRIDRIVHGLLDYARVREARPHPMAVNDVVLQTVELLTNQGRFKGMEVKLELGEDLPQVVGDLYQLQQVLVNLLVNGSDALTDVPDAAITIRTSSHIHRVAPHVPARRKDDPPGIDYSHRRRLFAMGRRFSGELFVPGAPVVEIAVIDNGPGIPPELMDQIFEPFVTTKEPGRGTGLGLAVSARLMEGMGGTIRASNGERGAIFQLSLPGAPVEAETGAAAGTSTRASPGRGRAAERSSTGRAPAAPPGVRRSSDERSPAEPSGADATASDRVQAPAGGAPQAHSQTGFDSHGKS